METFSAANLNIILLVSIFALSHVSVEGTRASYRCLRCRSHALYKNVFAWVVQGSSDTNPDRVKLNLKFFQHSACEEEGNYAHPLGNCRKYIRCHGKNQRPKIEECRPGFSFDPFTRECEDELNARDCKSCNRPQGYKIPHEKGGKRFYMCQDGAAYEFECVGSEKFDKHTRSCGNAQAVVKVEDVDGSYVPGSVGIYQKHEKKYRVSTGLMYNMKQQETEDKSTYREVV